MNDDIDRILISEEQITRRLGKIADEITKKYRGREFTVVSVLKGSCIFASDLIRRIPIPLELAFVSAGSYGNGTTAGDLDVHYLPQRSDIVARDLLLVDDILDTGRTMKALTEELMIAGARSVESCVFLDKPARRSVPYRPDYTGFEVEDLFVVGYGLDYAGRYRNLPYVGALKSHIFEKPLQQEAGR